MFQIPSGRRLGGFTSALVRGSKEFPLSEIPFQAIVDRVETGVYQAKPAHVPAFNQICEANRRMESGEANGKVVIVV